MDCLDLLAVHGILKSFLQHHSSKAAILWCSAFFTVQLSHPYMTTGKTVALNRQIFVGKVMSLLLNIPSRLVITFLSRSKCLNFMAAVTICTDFGAPKNKVCHSFLCYPIYLPWSDGTRCHDLSLQGHMSYHITLRSWAYIQKKHMVPKDTCTPMSIAVLFTIVKTWEQPKCLLKEEWIKKIWYTYTMEYYSVIKKNEIRPFAAT